MAAAPYLRYDWRTWPTASCCHRGYVYHVLNRANARIDIFNNDEDYEAFERVLAQAVEQTQTRLLAYCMMPNHWHLLV